jgi:hypothetical protein
MAAPGLDSGREVSLDEPANGVFVVRGQQRQLQPRQQQKGLDGGFMVERKAVQICGPGVAPPGSDAVVPESQRHGTNIRRNVSLPDTLGGLR